MTIGSGLDGEEEGEGVGVWHVLPGFNLSLFDLVSMWC